jgi:hypothetical protein
MHETFRHDYAASKQNQEWKVGRKLESTPSDFSIRGNVKGKPTSAVFDSAALPRRSVSNAPTKKKRLAGEIAR